MEEKLEDMCATLRKEILETGKVVLSLKGHDDFGTSVAELFPTQKGEMTANIMLSYRHLEDARMRLGKVMQQIQGGVSILDK